MKLNKVLASAVVGCALAVGSGAAVAGPCTAITSIAQWQAANNTCDQGDKTFTLSATDLAGTVGLLFSGPTPAFAMQIIGFDNSDAAAAWFIDYSVTVNDPTKFISDMFAGADNPGGGSLLTKDVSGDPTFNPFVLTVVNGAENAASEKHGLTATSLSVHETFSVNANANLLSVSNTYLQSTPVPEPATLLLLATGLMGLGWFTRRRDNRA